MPRAHSPMETAWLGNFSVFQCDASGCEHDTMITRMPIGAYNSLALHSILEPMVNSIIMYPPTSTISSSSFLPPTSEGITVVERRTTRCSKRVNSEFYSIKHPRRRMQSILDSSSNRVTLDSCWILPCGTACSWISSVMADCSSVGPVSSMFVVACEAVGTTMTVSANSDRDAHERDSTFPAARASPKGRDHRHRHRCRRHDDWLRCG
jgi:hypothetical protein